MVDIGKLKLPAVSSECVKILDMLSQRDANIQKIAKVVALDPILSAQLIKYANSPMYRRGKEITSVNVAVSLLGLKNVTAAIMMVTMKSFASTPTPLQDKIWQHSLVISTYAKTIAQKVVPALADDMELLGMLHDMGALVLAVNYPADYDHLYETALGNDQRLDTMEASAFGFDRDDIAAYLGEKFRLAETTRSVIENYHRAATALDLKSDVGTSRAVLALAHHLEVRHIDPQDMLAESAPASLEGVQTLFNLSADDIAALADQCAAALQARLEV